jgi:hypothetical protein
VKATARGTPTWIRSFFITPKTKEETGGVQTLSYRKLEEGEQEQGQGWKRLEKRLEEAGKIIERN